MRQIQRALANGWAISDEWLRILPGQIASILNSAKDQRTKLRAMELLASLRWQNISLALEVAKLEAREGVTKAELEAQIESFFAILQDSVPQRFLDAARARVAEALGAG